MASDLREIVAALKISSDLERIGDYAANIGKRVVALSQTPPFKLPAALPRMGWLAQQNIRDTLAAYSERNADKALRAWQADEELDETYSSLFRELLTHMMEDPRNIGSCTHLLFIAKNIERIGDHATNIAETVYFMVMGEPIGTARPKGDSTSYMTAPPAKH
jgi:phosphate transport system protein